MARVPKLGRSVALTRAGVAMVLSTLAATLPISAPARADEEDFEQEDVAPRRVAVELYPLDWLIGRYGAGAEAMLAEHHAVNLSAYWASVTESGTDKRPTGGAYDVRGVGAELGYRFYTGRRGPRGFFGGPSLLLGSFVLTPPPGALEYTAHHVGAAFDFGYQALVADDFVLAIGAGAQWTWIDRDVPSFTSINASSIVNGSIRPRVMTTIGWAF